MGPVAPAGTLPSPGNLEGDGALSRTGPCLGGRARGEGSPPATKEEPGPSQVFGESDTRVGTGCSRISRGRTQGNDPSRPGLALLVNTLHLPYEESFPPSSAKGLFLCVPPAGSHWSADWSMWPLLRVQSGSNIGESGGLSVVVTGHRRSGYVYFLFPCRVPPTKTPRPRTDSSPSSGVHLSYPGRVDPWPAPHTSRHPVGRRSPCRRTPVVL